MSMETSPAVDASAVSRTGKIVRWAFWITLWAAGVFLTAISALHIRADSHRWDARVSLPVRQSGATASAAFRSLSGGPVNLFATSLAHGTTTPVPFRGAIHIRVVGTDGSPLRETVLGREGVPHVQAMDSSWTSIGEVAAPRLWLASWRLEAQVHAADPAFPAGQIDLILRKERRDLGMGGMVFYVTIFIGIFLVVMAAVLAAVWRKILGPAPLVLATIAVTTGLMAMIA
jgi:hypothetical protein